MTGVLSLSPNRVYFFWSKCSTCIWCCIIEGRSCFHSISYDFLESWNSLDMIYNSHLEQPHCNEQRHLQIGQVAQYPVQPDLECFWAWGNHHLSGQCVPVFHYPHWEKLFLISDLNLPSFGWKPLSLVLSQKALLKCLFPSLETLFRAKIRSPWAFSGLNNLSLFSGEGLQSSDHFYGSPLALFQQIHMFSLLRTPELDAALQ